MQMMIFFIYLGFLTLHINKMAINLYSFGKTILCRKELTMHMQKISIIFTLELWGLIFTLGTLALTSVVSLCPKENLFMN